MSGSTSGCRATVGGDVVIVSVGKGDRDRDGDSTARSGEGGIGDDDVDGSHDFHHGDDDDVFGCGSRFVLLCLDINACSI